MDLEKIEIRKNFLKTPDVATLKHLIFIILWYQSSPSRSQAELLTIPLMKRCFERNGMAKDFDFKQKKSTWKKKRGSSRVEDSAPQLGMIPYFFDPSPRDIFFLSVILGPCLFSVINP